MREVNFENIQVTNFRNHEFMEFSFQPNRLVMITGDNGAGKSTIPGDAIMWALYDITIKGRKGDSVIRKRTGKNCSVILKFTIDDDHFEIRNYRKHNQYNDNKFLIMNGKDISESRKLVNERIVDLIMPSDIFLNCLLFGQNDNEKSFSEMTHSGQKGILDKMLGLEKYEVYSKATKASISEHNSLFKSKSQEFENQDSLINNNTNFLNEEKVNLNNIIDRNNNTIDELNKDISSIISLIKNLESNSKKDPKDLITKKEKIQNSLTILTSKINDAEKQIDITIKNTEESNKDQIDKINAEANSFKDQCISKFEASKNEIILEESRIKDPIKVDLNIVQLEDSNITNDIKTIEKLIKNLEFKISEIENDLNKDTPTCFVCKQEIRETSLDEVKTELKLNKDSLLEQNNKLILLNIKKSETTTKINQLQITIKDLEVDFSNKLNTAEKEMLRIKETISSKLSSKLEDLNKNLKDFKVNIFNTYKKETIESSNEKQKLEKELDGLIIELENFENSNQDLIRLNSKLESKTIELKNVTKNSEILINDIKSKIGKLELKIEEELNVSKTISDDINKLESDLNILDFWKQAFSDTGIKSILLDESIPIINDKSRELSSLTDCLRVRFDSQQQLKSGDLRNKFSISAIQTNNLTDSVEDMSRGEGRLIELICLLSLRHLLESMHSVRFNILILDEILDSLDPNNVNVVLSMIRKISEVQCVVLISHTLRDHIEVDEHLPM